MLVHLYGVAGSKVRLMIQHCRENDAASRAGRAVLTSCCCRGATATDAWLLFAWGFLGPLRNLTGLQFRHCTIWVVCVLSSIQTSNARKCFTRSPLFSGSRAVAVSACHRRWFWQPVPAGISSLAVSVEIPFGFPCSKFQNESLGQPRQKSVVTTLAM